MKILPRPSHDPFMMHRLHSFHMSRRSSKITRPAHLMMGLCAVLSLSSGFSGTYGLAGGVVNAGGGGTHAATGTYIIKVGGYFTGSGQASVSSAGVAISANVVDETGASGQLLVSKGLITNNRFRGTGTVMGQPITIEGRVDSADVKRTSKKSQVQINPRIVATFQTADDHHGRVVGQPDHSQQP